MNLSSHLLERLQHLPPPVTRDVVIERNLQVPMRDGAILLADRWAPRSGGDGLPTALMRSPYGRAGPIAMGMARPLAERGFQVLLQSTRGTFGSEGPFDPLRRERADGLDTVDWVVEQPWFGESIVLVGMSYLGFVQWAIADQAPPQIKAMIPVVSESALTLEFLRSDGFSLETPFLWGVQVDGQERRFVALRSLLGQRKAQRAMRTLPLSDADVAAVGHHVPYLQNMLTHDSNDPWWAALDHRHRVADVRVPASLIGGWFDIFLPGQLRDYQVMQDAGRAPRLTVGPWTHLSPATGSLATREAIDFALVHACGRQPAERAPVRLFVMGEEAWRDFSSWPPPGYPAERFHLHAGGALAVEPPRASAPDGYCYDPADPTPAVGGVRMTFTTKAGRVDNTKLEARPDVLTYTTGILERDVEVIGEVVTEIWFRSSAVCADVFVRLCDVDKKGRSTNICDGLTTVTGAEKGSCVTRGSGRLPTASRAATASASRCRVVPFLASIGTQVPANLAPPRCRCAPPISRSSTIPSTRPP